MRYWRWEACARLGELPVINWAGKAAQNAGSDSLLPKPACLSFKNVLCLENETEDISANEPHVLLLRVIGFNYEGTK